MAASPSPSSIQATRFGAALGARVEGLDLAAGLADDQLERVRSLFLEHQVLVFPEQQLSPEQLVAFASRFGPPTRHPLVPHLDGHPEVVEIRNAGKAATLNEHWHTDVSFQERPPHCTLLHAQQVPRVGGDTQFANQVLAWEALSEGMRRMLVRLRAVHTGAGLAAVLGKAAQSAPEAVHPVARTHPDTGREALYVCRAFTRRFEEMTRRESRPLLDFLFEHAARPDFTVRHAWRTGDLVLWDNRSVQHYAIHDHADAPRVLRRVTVDGERPFGPACPRE